jgi:hypothetical protein
VGREFGKFGGHGTPCYLKHRLTDANRLYDWRQIGVACEDRVNEGFPRDENDQLY